jgi:hypothetical protein
LERQAITKFTKYLCHACVEEAEINSSSYFIADKAAIERSDQQIQEVFHLAIFQDYKPKAG